MHSVENRAPFTRLRYGSLLLVRHRPPGREMKPLWCPSETPVHVPHNLFDLWRRIERQHARAFTPRPRPRVTVRGWHPDGPTAGTGSRVCTAAFPGVHSSSTVQHSIELCAAIDVARGCDGCSACTAMDSPVVVSHGGDVHHSQPPSRSQAGCFHAHGTHDGCAPLLFPGSTPVPRGNGCGTLACAARCQREP